MTNHTEILHLYVNDPTKSQSFSTITEALASLEEDVSNAGLQTFPAAADTHIAPAIIHVAPGIYEELLVISRPYVTLEGEDAATTIITYGLGAKDTMPDGDTRGTFRTASVRIDTHDFTARNITFQNNAGYGHTVGQALALYADGDRLVFEDCRLLGSQDTLFTAPLPPTEFQPGGFKGPGEHKERIMGRHLYRRCFIQGDIDFIFGSGIAYFEECTIYSKLPMDKDVSDADPDKIYGYISAASTPEGYEFGYVFKDCKLTSDCPPQSIYLGRPWREWAKTVYINCEMGAHIHPLGWDDWGKPHGHFYYGEYGSYGEGANPNARAAFSHQLTEDEVTKYTLSNVLSGIDGWMKELITH